MRAALGPQRIAERRYLETIRAVAALDCGAVSNIGYTWIFSARHLLAPVAVPPDVLDHAVCVRERAGHDRRVPGAGERLEVGVGGVPDPRPVRQQPLEAAGPVAPKPIDVIGPHLIDDDDDDE